MDLKYLRSVLIYLLSVAVSVFLIVYISYHLSGGASEDLTTAIAEVVTTQSTIDAEGYIMRNEQIVYSRSEGSVLCHFNDGEMVSVGDEIVSVYSGNEDVEARIAEIDAKIAILKKSSKNYGISDSVDTDIRSTYFDFLTSSSKGAMQSAGGDLDSLLVLLNRRRITVGAVSDFNSQIEALEKEKASLLLQMGELRDTVIAPCSGCFYSAVDGYEKIFSSSNAATMQLADFYKMTSSDSDGYIKHSAAGEAVGKMVVDSYWYLCFVMSNDNIRALERNNTYTVIFRDNDDAQIKMKLERIITVFGSEESVLLFGTRVTPEGFDFQRVQNVRVIAETCTGYKVPVTAVRYVDGKVGVYCLDVNRILFRTVDIIHETDGYYIAAINKEDGEALQIYDNIVTSGKNMYVGKFIE